jgi:hypothetical protein
VDLLQFHENIRMEDADRFFAPGVAVEALMDRLHRHKDPAVHLRRLQMAKERNYHFDTAQMPST